MPIKPAGEKRSDVRRNRQQILDAARETFASTSQIPLVEVARRAGVGNATLYRHFPDRAALIAAIVIDEIEGLEALVAAWPHEPGAFELFMQALLFAVADRHVLALVAIGRDSPFGDAVFDHTRARASAVFRTALGHARAAGEVRAEVTDEDLHLAVTMASGALEGVDGHDNRRQVADRVLALLMAGLAT